MKTTKHTSGPWAVSFPGGQTTFNGRRMTVTHNGSMIADLDWNTPAENLANAKLIAAAPDLLEACKVALEALNSAKIDTSVSFEFAAQMGDAKGKVKLAIFNAVNGGAE